jgi:uncharacterized membrane protein YdjX (TVP38/TMEM64 family)
MSSEVIVPKRKLPIVQLAVVGLILCVVAVLVLRGVDLKALSERGMSLIRSAGPVAFFSAMTILPAFGVPMIAFTVPAGEAFSGQMGLGGVIAASLVSIALNLALGYWVARFAFRPVLAGILKRYGYTVPRITPENALNVLLLVRLTPGPPYALQACLLGVAEAPFRLYMIISWLAVMPWALGGIILGQGIFRGNFKVVVFGLGLLIAAAAAVHWVRRKYFTRRET